MSFFDQDAPENLPAWTPEDVEVLQAVDPFCVPGICNVLAFIIANHGFVEDDTLDLALIFHSVANWNDDGYSFDDAEKVIAVASEFCLIDCVYDNQVLTLVEVQDNAVLFLALHDQHSSALEAAICLTDRDSSMFSNSSTLPSLSLFGEWEEFAVMLVDSLLTRGRLSDSIGSLMEHCAEAGLPVTSELEFVDTVRKLCAVGLLSVEIDDKGLATVHIERQPAGLFLLFSNRIEMAKSLASL